VITEAMMPSSVAHPHKGLALVVSPRRDAQTPQRRAGLTYTHGAARERQETPRDSPETPGDL